MENIIRVALTETKSIADLSEINYSQIEMIKQVNLTHNIDLIKKAASQNVQIICLNELFPAPYFAIREEINENWLHFAESAETGFIVNNLIKLSEKLEIVILAPIFEQTEADKRYNTTVIIEKGVVLGKYRKVHIPHGHNEQGNFTEGFYYNGSDDENMNNGCEKVKGHPLFPVFETQVCRLGVATCFDRHFQYVWQHLENGGAQIVFSPAVTFGKTSREAWEHEFPTEAVRHGFFIGGSNRKGQEFKDGPVFFGEGYFVGSDGIRLKNVSKFDKLVISDINLDDLKHDSSGWNLKRNQRLDLAVDALNND